MLKSVIVLDGHLKSALCTIRSLGRQKVPVIIGSDRKMAMGLYSRYTTKRFIYPSALSDQRGFVDAVKKVAYETGDMPVLYAFSDATYCALYQYRKELESCATFLFPAERSFEIVFDKAATYSEAKVLGIPAITTYLREQLFEVKQIAKELSFPAVIKPRRSVRYQNGAGVFGTAQFVHNEEELLEVYTVLFKKTGEAPLIQPFVQGEEYGVGLVAYKGEVCAQVAHHRVRSLSPTGGASVVKEILDEESHDAKTMHAHATKLAKELNWSGPMMCEFKIESDSKEVQLMEINGRWWGSLPLAVVSEVDLPYVYWCIATEKKCPDMQARSISGTITRHFLGDVQHLLRVLFARDPMRLRLYPSRKKALHDFFFQKKRTKSDVWKWSDPVPSFMEHLDVFVKYIKHITS